MPLWETASWRESSIMPSAVDESASLFAYRSDGKVLATYNDHHVRFWDAQTGLQRGLSEERISQPLGLVFAPGSALLALGDASGRLRLIDSSSGATVGLVEAHRG